MTSPEKKTTTLIRVALPIALLLGATAARAEDEPTPTSQYRWQAVTADAVALGVGIAGFSLEGKDGSLNYIPSNTMMGIGIGGYFLGAPVVHATHRHFGRAGVSLALRVVLPVIGAAIGGQTATCSRDEWLCGLEELAAGFWLGAVGAMVVDNVLLFSLPGSEAEPVRTAPPTRSASRFHIEPRVAAAPNAAVLGVGGRF